MTNRVPRGITVGGTLLAVTILAALAAALASLCVTHIRTSNRVESAHHASNLARSAIAQAIAEVIENQEFGVEQRPEATVTIETEMGTAFLTFNPELAEQQSVVCSTNNSAGTTTVEGGQGRVVPANSVHLIAQGSSGGVVRQVESIIAIPTFPWALAAEGEIVIRDGAMIGSLPEGVWPPDEGSLEPADLVSNSDSESAIVLGSKSRVMGDVETPGRVVLVDSTVQVDGQIRETSQPTALPSLEMDDYDPKVQEIAYDDLTGESGSRFGASTGPGGGKKSGFSLSGAARHEGDFVVNEDIVLDGAILFVDGNLTVNGGIQGTGLLVVDGDISVSSGVSLEGATEVAVISAGKVVLKGAGPKRSSIRGLFYAEGGLLAEEITLVGAMIAAGPEASVELDNSRMLGQSIGPSSASGEEPGGKKTGPGGGKYYGYLLRKRAAESGKGGGSESKGAGESEASSFIPLKERVRVVSWFES